MSPRSARTATLAALVLAITSATAQAATPSSYVYATSFDRLVRQYAADNSGMLSALTPPEATADDASSGVAASPDGRSLYVVNQGSDSVSQYDVGLGGVLTPKTPATVATGEFPFGIAVAPDSLRRRCERDLRAARGRGHGHAGLELCPHVLRPQCPLSGWGLVYWQPPSPPPPCPASPPARSTARRCTPRCGCS